MQEIRKQVRRARGRLILQQFVTICGWSLFATLMVALIGIAIPKIWVISVDANTWFASWGLGAICSGLVLSIALTYMLRRDSIDAAIEIDKRFGLKERVSSALALTEGEVDTEAGQALMQDAEKRISRIDVRDEFKFSFTWKSMLPLLPAALVFASLVLPNATLTTETEAATESEQKIEQAIKKAQAALRKKIEKKRKDAEAKGLKETSDIFKKMEKNLDALKKKKQGDVQKALAKLNDLKSELEKRRKELGGSEKLKKQLAAMKNLQQGPADKMIKAIKRGDMKTAIKEIKKMQDKMKNGKLSEKDKKRLSKQLQAMQKKMENMIKAHQQAKKALKKKIENLQKQGKLAEAGKLQQKLNQLKQQDKQMNRMNQMAQNLNKAAQALQKAAQKGGKPQQQQQNMNQAAQQMDQLAKQMDQMQREMDDLETIDEVMDQISAAKSGMAEGMGDMGNLGMNQGNERMDQFSQGQGNGPGQGQGERGFQKTKTKQYDSQVRAKPKQGEAMILGTADGPNRKGRSREAILTRLRSSDQVEADPTENIRLPRDQANHTREYFNRLRKR